VLGTQAMLEFTRRRGIRRFIFGSSSSVYGNSRKVPFSEDDPILDPISPYAATKVAGEILCRTYHRLYEMGIIALRFFTVYGPRQRPDLAIRKFTTLMLRGDPVPVFGDGTSARDYTWVDDILRGVEAAIDRTRFVPGRLDLINLGGSQPNSLRRLVELIANAVGLEPVIDRWPAQLGDVVRTYADISKAGRLLGYRPHVTLDEGIPRFVEWMRRGEVALEVDGPRTPGAAKTVGVADRRAHAHR
jgi:UDP-glucuronate 4-epimerase